MIRLNNHRIPCSMVVAANIAIKFWLAGHCVGAIDSLNCIIVICMHAVSLVYREIVFAIIPLTMSSTCEIKWIHTGKRVSLQVVSSCSRSFSRIGDKGNIVFTAKV